MNASFLTGPVAVRPEVRDAFRAPPVSHRAPEFLAMMQRTRTSLCSLVNAPRVSLMVGSGTLANDAVAAQIRGLGKPGLILSNGEFGERLIDHARRWGIRFVAERTPWGRAFDWRRVRKVVRRRRPSWIWAVLTETSTGVMNPLQELRALGEDVGAELCLDAVSAIGLVPVDLAGVRFATAVSGKGLAAFPGLAAVFHDGQLARSAQIPRYLDLAAYEAADGVPYTHSSNLVAALECSLSSTSWPDKFEFVREKSQWLRRRLRLSSLAPLAREEDSAPGIITLESRGGVEAEALALRLAGHGIDVGYQSQYLRARNWLQIALMGEIDEAALELIPGLIARHAPTASLSAAHHSGAENSPRRPAVLLSTHP